MGSFLTVLLLLEKVLSLFSLPVSHFSVGTLAEVVQCEFLADGRALILIEGRERFRIRETWEEDGTQGLVYASIEVFDDLPEPLVSAETMNRLHERAIQSVHSYLEALSPSCRRTVLDRFGEIPLRCARRLSMWAASVLPASTCLRRQLLEHSCTSRRLKEVVQTFDILIPLVRQNRISSSACKSTDS